MNIKKFFRHQLFLTFFKNYAKAFVNNMKSDYVLFEEISNMNKYFEYCAFPECAYWQCLVTICSTAQEKYIFGFKMMKLLLH